MNLPALQDLAATYDESSATEQGAVTLARGRTYRRLLLLSAGSLTAVACLSLLTGCLWTAQDTADSKTALTNWTERTAASTEQMAADWHRNSDRMATSMESIAASFARMDFNLSNLTVAASKRINTSTVTAEQNRPLWVILGAMVAVYIGCHAISEAVKWWRRRK
jgi:hypothetical protein